MQYNINEMKIEIEIGNNLKEVITKILESSYDLSDDTKPELLKAIMGEFTDMIMNHQTYICPMCGTANFIGESCVRCKEK
jgi:hypothetical protein